MGEYVKGFLEQNNDGATYEGIVYDRRLTIRCPNARALSVFDPGAISASLPTGAFYELILRPLLPVSARVLPTRPGNSEANWYGEIIDLHWEALDLRCKRAIASLYEHQWILLATPLGQMLLNRSSEIASTMKAGSYLQWPESRLDLVAIV